MRSRLKVLAPVRYPWRFNGPRNSRHEIDLRYFLPLNKLSYRIEGITAFNPLPLTTFDIIHAFNRIPIGQTPFIIGFESHMPRCFGPNASWLFTAMAEMLSSDRCRGIVAISEYARRLFMCQHRDKPWGSSLLAKLSVRYPNVVVADVPQRVELVDGVPIRLVFVGNHFGRKGGAVVLRLAEMAQQQGLNLEIDVISSMELGRTDWVSPTRDEFWHKYLALFDNLASVRVVSHLPNDEVLRRIGRAHFLLLPTFADTFGYSVIEAMAMGTPVIATAQSALPEFIADNVDGYLLRLETNQYGEWIHGGRSDRDNRKFESIFDETVDALAREALSKLLMIAGDRRAYDGLRTRAHAKARSLFDATDATIFWDNLYQAALS